MAHTALDVAGLIPGIGAAFDALNGAFYAVERRYVEAGWSFAAAIPGAGDALGALKLARGAVKTGQTLQKASRAADIGVNLAESSYYGYRGYQEGSIVQQENCKVRN